MGFSAGDFQVIFSQTCFHEYDMAPAEIAAWDIHVQILTLKSKPRWRISTQISDFKALDQSSQVDLDQAHALAVAAPLQLSYPFRLHTNMELTQYQPKIPMEGLAKW